MYKVQYLDTYRWIDCMCGYDEQQSIKKATDWSNFYPNRKVRVVQEVNGRDVVVYFT
jgi:hypothetical protein